uniref:Thioredoxin domain-containing protein n=1 Tax=Arion vulgaris TaxID=1028688 RepID=A0A0B7BLJ8_9EUPU
MALVTLLGSEVKGKDGSVNVTSLSDNDVVGIYFSAHWCPPCRAFTPVFGEYYKKLRADGKKFEVVFVSSDREEEACDEYYSQMPWLILPYKDRQRKEQLSQKYGVRGIPTVVFLDAKTGELISQDGRKIVNTDVNGDGFPWK